MSVSAWDKALFAAPPRIMGRVLHPFSLAHSRALKMVQSPYVSGGIVTGADTLVAVAICSRNMAQIEREVFGTMRPPWKSAWAVWWGVRVKWNFTSAHAALTEYFGDFADEPDHEDRGGKKYAAPWEFHHIRVLCDHYGYTTRAAWDESVVMARCLYDAHNESQGDDSLISTTMAEGYAMIAEANRLAKQGRQDEADALYLKAAPMVRKD